MAEMQEPDLRETTAGRIVVKPGCNMKEPHPLWADPIEAEAPKVCLNDLHRAKIRLADEVIVVGPYIRSSTTAEIAYARELGKPVRFTHPEVAPAIDAASTAPTAERHETVEYFVQAQQPDGSWKQAGITTRDLDFVTARLTARRAWRPGYHFRIARRATAVVVEAHNTPGSEQEQQ